MSMIKKIYKITSGESLVVLLNNGECFKISKSELAVAKSNYEKELAGIGVKNGLVSLEHFDSKSCKDCVHIRNKNNKYYLNSFEISNIEAKTLIET